VEVAFGSSESAVANHVRGGFGEGRARPSLRRFPWRDESPGELCAEAGLNRRVRVTDSRAEQSPVVESRAFSDFALSQTVAGAYVLGESDCLRYAAGISEVRFNARRACGTGDGVRLHVRSKALKGTTPRADPAWNKAGRLVADESARRLRKPVGATPGAAR
jgi:hypothetical protein